MMGTQMESKTVRKIVRNGWNACRSIKQNVVCSTFVHLMDRGPFFSRPQDGRDGWSLKRERMDDAGWFVNRFTNFNSVSIIVLEFLMQLGFIDPFWYYSCFHIRRALVVIRDFS